MSKLPISGLTIRRLRLTLLTSLVCSLATSLDRGVFADDQEKSQLVNLSSNMMIQSENVDLPEDFIARVEDGKVKVILESLGESGQRSARSNLLVSLLDEDGIKQVATTNSSGVAEFTNVRVDALHALLVNDTNFHAAIPVLTMSPEKANEKNVVAGDVRIAPMPADRDAILASVASSSTPSSAAGALLGVGDYRPSALTTYRVQLNKDGTLDGRVVIADRDLDQSERYANITIFRNRQPIARTTANAEDGSFGLPNLVAGVYGVIASGPAGYSAFEFEVLPASVDPNMPKDPENLPVSLNAAVAASKLYVFLIPPKLMVKVREEIQNGYRVEPVSGEMLGSQPGGFAGGGFGGGGFGGGGFGGGGFGGGGAPMSGLGGGGGLGLMAAAGIAAAAIASGDDSQPVVVSPIAP